MEDFAFPLVAFAVPLGHLAVSIGVTVLLIFAWQKTAMRGWLLLSISWALGCVGSLPGLYSLWLLHRSTPSDYGRFAMKLAIFQTLLSAATTLLTVGGFVILFSECRRLLARRAT